MAVSCDDRNETSFCVKYKGVACLGTGLLALKDELASWLETVSDWIKRECRPKCKTW